MANNAILFRVSHLLQIRDAVKDYFKTTQWGSYANYVNHKDNREDFEFIRIRNDVIGRRYFLPIETRDNPKFAKLKEIADSVSGVTLVQLVKKDFPEYFLDDTPTDFSIPL